MKETPIHQQWSSRLAFIFAAVGSAIGLGNIWKFPYIAGENGGGAFILVYLVCVFLISFPVMIAEVLIGRRTHKSPVNAMEKMALEAKQSPHWSLLGWMGVIAGFLILSYYSVIAGWTLSYVLKSLTNTFGELFATTATQDYAAAIETVFSNTIANPWMLLLFHSIFMFMTMLVIAQGVRSGLEKAVSSLVPLLFVLLIILIFYAFSMPGWNQAIDFMFNFRFEDLNAASVLEAMGHAFFTLSLGMGAIMVYGSYLPNKVSITHASFIVVSMDTIVSIAASLIIFPLVFSYGLEPGAGPGLVFVTLPIAFGQMSFGIIIGSIFFILLLFAAWTSAISLLEPAIAWLIENKNLKRYQASIFMGLLTWLTGLLTIFSFNIWSGFTPGDKTIFDWIDFLTSNIMLPIGGLFIAIFVGWLVSNKVTSEELNTSPNNIFYLLWKFLIRFLAPITIIIIFIYKLLDTLGLLKGAA